jgi:hypothetical protein
VRAGEEVGRVNLEPQPEQRCELEAELLAEVPEGADGGLVFPREGRWEGLLGFGVDEGAEVEGSGGWVSGM